MTGRDGTAPLQPIARLRRIAAALEGGRLPEACDRAWFCTAVREYETAAPAGGTFDRAAGLTPNRGRAPWWVEEARQRRDAAIRQMRDRLFPDLRRSEAAQQIARLNARLARERTIPADVADAVREIRAGVTETGLTRWEAIDPYLTLIIHRAVIQAEAATLEPDEPAARDRLRVALESLRQGFAAIAEGELVADARSPKELVRWLTETLEVPQSRLAGLLGVSLRTFQRWASDLETAAPQGADARRIRAVARIVNQLRFVLAPAGAVEWFSWPRTDLRGKRPLDLLDEPRRLPDLAAAAASMRSTYAA